MPLTTDPVEPNAPPREPPTTEPARGERVPLFAVDLEPVNDWLVD